ncbi:two component, sigma54 specific, transcriptional regulator, Fis family [Spirochaeta thermophila DSM 6578]|uniref:Two component, sigma54 specific, transcriptional regulator, Fis family n=1 Tax=Winmispira thermophila (strain ATCC 700085 / DSM 6578 / Z-1203) TaxID=869211 RepID=G0GDF0_WINT7|nr:sigma-54 dependent transcriptional regulator [Spirochaeta thermophila]AEJ60576.1 two component, sigma54 specific, transcriptional regulator, Fis family [Spirochaeta thermophila DSM 6578]
MTVLVVDDERDVVEGFRMAFPEWEVRGAGSGAEALRVLESEPVDLVFLDVRLGREDGLSLLGRMKERRPELPCVMISAYGTVERAVEALRLGAVDFLEKPLSFEKVRIVAERTASEVFARRVVEQERERYALLGESEAVREVRRLIEKAARVEVPVLVTGESGTGKEHVARLVHLSSRRARGPLVALNCAAVPADLFESEIFGHEKGSFTGAERRRRGRIEEARGGTLFLDEVGELPASQQAKLLRVLETGEYYPVGAERPRRADVRVVCATNRDLEAMVREGSFRADLYYRLGVLRIHIPPLRERREDIPLLAQVFLRRVSEELGQERTFSREALSVLMEGEYPGNVRELQHLVWRAALLSEGPVIGPEVVGKVRDEGRKAFSDDLLFAPRPLGEARREFERAYIAYHLSRCGGNVSRTARELGMAPSNLMRRMRELGMR